MTLNNVSQYGYQFQIKVISSLLTHKSFLINIHDIISDEYFENSAFKWIINEVLSYYDKYHSTISMEVLKIELQKLENEVLQISIKEQLKEAYVSSKDDLEYVQEEFTNFCKNQQLKRALLSSVDLLQAGDYEGIRFLVDSALKAGQEKNLGHEYEKDIETRYREDSRVVVPTPWDIFNRLLQGGLGNGDFGLIYGGPGGGKSWMLVALGAFAARLGYNVLHYTLELSEEYVGLRYDANFTGISVSNIKKHKAEVETLVAQIPGKVIIKEYPTGRVTLSTIEAHIEQCKSLGFNPDLIIIDYLDLLKAKRKSIDKKAEIDYIYLGAKGLAKTLNLPLWSVSQVNRAGAQDNIIEGDKAAGSYDKQMITDFSASLSRKRKDKVDGTGRFHIMKNRYGRDGLSYSAKINTECGRFELFEYNEDEEDNSSRKEQDQKPKWGNEIDVDDREVLRKKFFELKDKY